MVMVDRETEREREREILGHTVHACCAPAGCAPARPAAQPAATRAKAGETVK